MNRIRIIAGIVAATLVLGAVAGGVVWKRQRLPASAAFRLAGSTTTETVLRQQVAALRSLYGIEPPAGAKKLDVFWRDAAKAAAVGEVLERAAADRSIVIPERAAQASLTAYVEQLYGTGTQARQAFVAALGTAGTSEKVVLAELRRQLQIAKLYDAVVAHTAIPAPTTVAQAFERRKCSLVSPERRAISNVVVTSESEARQVLRRLRKGEDFAAVAASASADTSTNESGGQLGTVARSQLDAAFGAAAFGASRGALFGPVKSAYGWNVGQVTQIVPAATATAAQVAQPMRDLLVAERRSDAWRSWLRSTIAGAHVRYAGSYEPADPDAPPSALGAKDATPSCPDLTGGSTS